MWEEGLDFQGRKTQAEHSVTWDLLPNHIVVYLNERTNKRHTYIKIWYFKYLHICSTKIANLGAATQMLSIVEIKIECK